MRRRGSIANTPKSLRQEPVGFIAWLDGLRGVAHGLPYHEIVQRLPGFVRDKSDNGRVIDEAEKRSLVRNQIEWVDQIIESSYDPHQSITRNLLVFTALVRVDQAQHRLNIRPILLERLPREGRSLSRGLFKKRAQAAGTDDT